MKKSFLIVSLAFLLSSVSYASVRPGTSIAASIKSSNVSELGSDLSTMGLDSSKADVILRAVEANILTADQLGNLMGATDANKVDMAKKYISELIPAALNVEASNADASALMSTSQQEDSTASKRKDEIKKIGMLIVGSIQGSDVPMKNVPKIMDIVKDVTTGSKTEVEANALLAEKDANNESLVTLPEGETDALKALRDCT